MYIRRSVMSTAAVATLAMPAALHAGNPVEVEIDVVAAEGQVPPGGDGSAFTSLNPPYTDSLGNVGFVGILASGDRIIWHTDGGVWLNSDALPEHTLTGAEGTMGISDAGGFIYSPSADGGDAVYTHEGLLLRDDDPAPSMPGFWATFNSRPRMTPNGVAWWVAGISSVKGGSTQGRVLYVNADPANPSSASPAISTFNEYEVDGEMYTPTNSGIGFAYDMSDDSQHFINVLTLGGLPSGSNDFILVNLSLPHREGELTGEDEVTVWSSFRGTSINNSGEYTFGGATAGGDTATQEFLAYNGEIIVRRGDTLDGVLLEDNWATRWTSINNLGQIAHLWEGGFGSSASGTLFVTLDPDDVAGSTIAIASIGDGVDTTGDSIPDATLVDFSASASVAPGLDFSDHPWVYVEVDLEDLTTEEEYEAILRVSFDVGESCAADLTGDESVGVPDLLALLAEWGECPGCPADLTGDDTVGVPDLLALLAAWGDCP